MSSVSKYLPRKNTERVKVTESHRVIEVPLAHAAVATEAHLRAISIINDNEDADITFTPTMVRINLKAQRRCTTK